jgi:autoinducer 2-degrading protein
MTRAAIALRSPEGLATSASVEAAGKESTTMYVVVAEYYAKAGNDSEIAKILAKMVSISRAERGCAMYIVNRSIDDPRRFLIYEQYYDKGGYQAHMETYPFKDNILVRVIPMLENSQLGFYEVLVPK